MVPANSPAANKPAPRNPVKVTLPPKRIVPITNAIKKPSPPPIAQKAPAPAPPPLTPADQENDETYDVADDDVSQLGSLLPSAEAIAAAEREIPPMLAAQAETPEALEYQRPSKIARKPREQRIDPDTGEFIDPMRDYIVPAILVAVALGSIALYICQRMGTSPIAGLAISVALGIMLGIALFKTVVLTFVSFPLATYCDINIGLLRTAIFKLGAIILFADVAVMWVIALLEAGGVMSEKTTSSVEIWAISVIGLTVMYQLAFVYLFRLSAADLKFAALMSLASRLCNFFMWLILVAFVVSWIANHSQPSASPYIPVSQVPPTISPGTPMTVQPGQNVPTALDELISQRIKQHPFEMQEGFAWCRSGGADDADRKLVNDIYAAGADKVYVDGISLYAQLPGDPAKRAACMKVADAFRQDNGMSNKVDNMNYEYAVVDLMGERFKDLHH